MPILGHMGNRYATLCYCDMFCDRPADGGDCCPDFKPVCRGVTPAPQPRADCSYNVSSESL